MAAGSRAAWLLAQHADLRLGVQRTALALMTGAVAAGDGCARDLAHLVDRVAVDEGREQAYGVSPRRAANVLACP
jgi:hypothetical protein